MKGFHIMCCTRLTAVLGMTLSLLTVSVADAQIRQGSLRNGNYGNGAVINTFPLPGVPPRVIATPDGALFIATEVNGRSNALINWQIRNNANFRRRGTITFLFKAIRGQLSAISGQIVGDNYGFNQFNNGQATFSVAVGPLLNGPGPRTTVCG